MNTRSVEITIRTFRTEELSGEEKQWMDAAVAAARQAYAPYSGFRVGAVAVLADGTLVTGNNQENIASPSGMCAERVALFSAHARYPEAPVKALAVAAVRGDRIVPSIAPCGSCRQVLQETERRQRHPVRILLCGCEEVRCVDSAASLLPLSFEQTFDEHR
ncbi:MAG: cytidine deaminase [Tannerella sp.]|jgi:cytidine deaminase|nr:cytidine deaminase [Tannerella sp.]